MGDPQTATGEPPFDVAPIVSELRDVRDTWRQEHGRDGAFGQCGFPSRHALGRVIDVLSSALFPQRLGPPDLRQGNEDCFVRASLESAIPLLAAQIRMELHYVR